MALLRVRRQAAGVYSCDPAVLYDVLTDYDAYIDWVPLLTRSKLLAREGELAIAEFELAGHGHDKLVVECIHSRNTMVLGRTIAGDVPVTKIEWQFAPAEGGGTAVRLNIEGRWSWRWILPRYHRFLHAKRLLQALRAHLACFAPDFASQPGEKVLDLYETPDGLFLIFRGKKYALTLVSAGEHD